MKENFFTTKKSFFLYLLRKLKNKIMGQNPNNGTSSPANGKKDFQTLIDECNRLKDENKFLKNEMESLKNINNEVTKNNQNLARKNVEEHEQYKNTTNTSQR